MSNEFGSYGDGNQISFSSVPATELKPNPKDPIFDGTPKSLDRIALAFISRAVDNYSQYELFIRYINMALIYRQAADRLRGGESL